MKILLVSTQDYIHHPIPSRHHYIFEDMATRHEIHVAHFHVSRGIARPTRLTVEEATQVPLRSPLLHYTINAPYHFYRFNQLVRDQDFDVIVAAHVLAGTAVTRAAKKYRVPVLFDLKDWFPDSAAAYFNNSLLQQLVRKSVWEITRHNLLQSTRITTVSPSLVEKLKRLGFSAGLITNGVDTDIFRPMEGDGTRKELGIGKNDFVIGFSGSVERWYALDEMIRALPELLRINPATRLLIVGGSLFTTYETELRSLAQALNVSDRIVFTGTKPYHDLPRFIACMDACTIPLSPPQWGDIALPNKFFEYSACGKPIIMRPIPDVARIGGPHLREYRTQEEYIAHMKALMENPQKYSINLQNFSWKEKSRQMEAELQAIL
ncbi:MAG: glycosyltransferase family 4 protein [Methanomicrobiales archaeon]|nr:glycosyltransferase family 4 protein [Methanomicrobiales archaeon]